MNALEETWRIARAQALIALGSTVPGYFVSVALIDRIGRIPIQLGGYLIMSVLLAILAGLYETLRDHSTNWFMCALGTRPPARRYRRTRLVAPATHASLSFSTLYALTFFFSNFGASLCVGQELRAAAF